MIRDFVARYRWTRGTAKGIRYENGVLASLRYAWVNRGTPWPRDGA